MRPATLLLGLAASAVLAAEAGACSTAHRTPDEHPFYAALVREAASIDLARVAAVGPIPEASQFHIAGLREPDRRVDFVSVEHLKGPPELRFGFDYVDPERADGWGGPGGPDPDAAPGHSRLAFWTEIYGRGCASPFPDFREGETYLVFRNAGGGPLDLANGFHRNFRRIEREDDAWLAAVRTLAADPSAAFGRSMAVSDFVTAYGGVGAVVTEWACPDGEWLEFAPLESRQDFLFLDMWSSEARESREPDRLYWGLGYEQPGPVICPEQPRQSRGGAARLDCPMPPGGFCTAEGRTLRIPTAGGMNLEGAGGFFFNMRSFEITQDDHVVFTNDGIEIELTGDLRAPLAEVRAWFEGERE